MAYIDMIRPADATGPLADLYEQIARARGGVADIHQVQSLNPRAMSAHLEFYKAVMFLPSPLPRAWREAIGVAVSRANGCAYCIAHHETALAGLGGAPAPEVLLAWATRLTTQPGSCSETDVAALRGLGLDDRAILDAIQVVGYFNYVNRLVLATGLGLEPDFERTCQPTLADGVPTGPDQES